MSATHFRSNVAVNGIFTNAGNAAQYQAHLVNALRVAGSQFYTTAGGLVLPDPPATTAFIGNITVRGGIIGIRVANINSVASTIETKIYLVKTSKAYNQLAFPANPFVGWDPSMQADFQRDIGRVIMVREALLENNASLDVKFRLRPFKIDRDEYEADKSSFVWVILQNDVEGNASALSVCGYYNISFAADGIGTA